ncbi:hypothetical protein AKJ09_07881 [Labilithrix luteola]|uniref:Uncharacterized protein n=1 Tax=Labilithrix luteola TaxID=1391654 RepID=A0A0K1Q672_9BACT|nr:hypothetical protein AKJ09_07881 [Labilithrix luteola]
MRDVASLLAPATPFAQYQRVPRQGCVTLRVSWLQRRLSRSIKEFLGKGA